MRPLLPAFLFLAGCLASLHSQDTVSEPVQSNPSDPAYKVLFESGLYQETIELLESSMAGSPEGLQGDYVRYLAYSYILTGAKDRAVTLFQRMLTQDPDFSLDPIRTSPKLFEVFHRARAEWLGSGAGRLAQLRKREVQDSLKALQAARMAEALRWRFSPLDLSPGGAGQFRRGRTTRGRVWLGIQGALLTGSILAYAKRRTYWDDRTGWDAARADDNRFYTNLYRVQFGLFGLAWAAGIGDLFLFPSRHRGDSP